MRRLLTIGFYQKLCFNPRTRKGCDKGSITPSYDMQSFNPRTRKGCDAIQVVGTPRGVSFNPRTRKGCDYMFMESFIDNIFSI